MNLSATALTAVSGFVCGGGGDRLTEQLRGAAYVPRFSAMSAIAQSRHELVQRTCPLLWWSLLDVKHRICLLVTQSGHWAASPRALQRGSLNP